MNKILIPLIISFIYLTSCGEESNTNNVEKNDEPETSEFYAEYPFDNNTNDISKNEFHGIDKGAISYVNDRNDNEKSAVYFDGFSHINLPFSGMLDFEDDFAISFWAKVGEQLSDKGSFHFDIVSNSIWGQGSFFVGLNKFQEYEAYSWDSDGGEHKFAYLDEEYFDDQWHHIAYNFDFTVDNKIEVSLYIDGELKEIDEIGIPNWQNYEPTIGARVDLNSYFTGTLDDLIISDRLFTTAEIIEQADITIVTEE